MIDFSKLLTPEQKSRVEKRKQEKAKRTVGIFTAQDEEGNFFEKIVILSENLEVLDFGWPGQYYLNNLFLEDYDQTKNFYIDAGGRGHKGSPVYFEIQEFKRIVKMAFALRKRLKQLEGERK